MYRTLQNRHQLVIQYSIIYIITYYTIYCSSIYMICCMYHVYIMILKIHTYISCMSVFHPQVTQGERRLYVIINMFLDSVVPLLYLQIESPCHVSLSFSLRFPHVAMCPCFAAAKNCAPRARSFRSAPQVERSKSPSAEL